MDGLRFEWSSAKAAANARTHRIGFDEARSVFADERARLIADPDRSADEDGFIILGLSAALRLLVVCHCYRGKDNVIRIISARKATSAEAKFY